MRMQNDDDNVVAMVVVRPLTHRCPISRPRATSLPNLIGAPMPNHECTNALAAVHVTPNWSVTTPFPTYLAPPPTLHLGRATTHPPTVN